MPRVFIPALLRPLTSGQTEVEIEGSTVLGLIENLEARFPGFKDRLVDQGRLRPNIAIAVDDDIAPLGLNEAVSPTAEVHFIAAIRGG